MTPCQPDYSVLKERLRAVKLPYRLNDEGTGTIRVEVPVNPDGDEAAEAITTLEARIAQLEGAMKPFASYADGVGHFSGPNSPFYIGFESHVVGQRFISEEDFRRAGAALGKG